MKQNIFVIIGIGFLIFSLCLTAINAQLIIVEVDAEAIPRSLSEHAPEGWHKVYNCEGINMSKMIRVEQACEYEGLKLD